MTKLEKLLEKKKILIAKLEELQKQINEQKEIESQSEFWQCLPRQQSVQAFQKLKLLYELHNSGRSVEELAKLLGVSAARIESEIQNADLRWGSASETAKNREAI